jgi:hypothetical protein
MSESPIPSTLQPNDILFASARASVHFTLRCLEPAPTGLRARSSFVTPAGEAMHWHDFGDLEGPGWAANAVGGAHLLYKWGRFVDDAGIRQQGIDLLRHVLADGFVDAETGFIWPYYDLAKQCFCLNYDHGDEWLCPGSLAKIGVQMLDFADDLIEEAPAVAQAAVTAAVKLGAWLHAHTPLLPNGWVPRRITPAGEPFPFTPHGHPDPIYDHSADGIFLLQLWAELLRRGLEDYRAEAAGLADAFVNAGGFWGSINHDTYDDHESVAYSCAARILARAADVLERPECYEFARAVVLPELERFRMAEDRNGVPTKGLLWMEATWDTAYLWENAEAAWAWLEAWADTGDEGYRSRGLEVLTAISEHHSGPLGFLTEGVDWNNHVTRRHHVDGVLYGDINYTEPLLNHLHFLGPTLYYFEQTGYTPPQMDDATAIGLVQRAARAARPPVPGSDGAGYFVRLYHPAFATDARVEEALRFCAAIKADGVLLFESSYDMDPRLLTLDQLAARFARLKQIVPRFREIVREVHINVMITIGHVDSGSARPERFAFQFQVNEHGETSRSTACPLNSAFLAYASEIYRMAAACGADVVWVDDDVRFVLHDVPGMTCFCSDHLAALAQKTGRAWTRDELVAALRQDVGASAHTDLSGTTAMDLTVTGSVADGPAVRRAWFDVQEDAMLGLARTVETAVHGVAPQARIGLMTIGTAYHSAEGRRTDRLLRTLAGGARPGGTRPLIRPGSGYYSDWTPAGVLDKSEDGARQMGYLGADVQGCAEVENHPYTAFGKSATILSLELALDVLAGMPSLSLNVLSSMGGTGPLEPEGSGMARLLAQQRPFLDALAQECAGRLRRGIGILDSEDYARQAPLRGKPLMSWIEPRPWEQMLARTGLPIGRPDVSPHWLAGDAVRGLSNYDIVQVLSDGAVLDPLAAQALIDMGWGGRLGIRAVRPVGDGVNELLVAAQPVAALPVAALPVAALPGAGRDRAGEILPTFNHVPREQLYTYDFEPAGAQVLSRWLNTDGEDRGPACVALQRPTVNPRVNSPFRVGLLPYTLVTPAPGLLNIAHRAQWAGLIEWASGRPLPCRVIESVNLYPLAFERPDDASWLIAIANLSADDAPDAELDIKGLGPGARWQVETLTADGQWQPAAAPHGERLNVNAGAFSLAAYRLRRPVRP